MIKTHKPRGRPWTCLSAFQRSEEIRNIRYEDCTPPDDEILADGSHDDLLPSQRAAKRRRIENLANRFLDGEPLIIASAKAHPQSTIHALQWNERSRTGRKDVIPQLNAENSGTQIWVDIDEPEIPAKQSRTKVRKGKAMPIKAENSAPLVQVDEEQASSACRQGKHRAMHKISLEPSTAAVKQAAALRDRRLQRAATEAPGAAAVIDESTPEPGVSSEPNSIVRPRFFRNRKPPGTEWLLRRNTALYELSADESIDELSRSETPSRPSQQPRHSMPLDTTSRDAGSYAADVLFSTDDLAKTQDKVSKSASPRRHSAPSTSQPSKREPRPPVLGRPSYTMVPSTDKDGTPFMFRKRRPRPGTPEGPLFHAGTSRSKDDDGSKTTAALAAAPKATSDRPKRFVGAVPPTLDMSLGHDSSFGLRLNMALVDEHLNALLPTEPGSNRRSSSVKKALRQELTEAGADITRIEGEPLSSQVESQMVEKIDNGQEENSACPTSATADAEVPLEEDQNLSRGEVTASQWPGTQMALYQAQRDLMSSPQKPVTIEEASQSPADRSESYLASLPDAAPRPPLRELSQEQLPSTQAIMNAWSPWSAMKKPAGVTKAQPVTAPSPIPSNIRGNPRRRSPRLSAGASNSDVAISKDSARRRSSLRFSMTSDSATPARLQYSVTKSASQEARESLNKDESPLLSFRDSFRESTGSAHMTPGSAIPTRDATTVVDSTSAGSNVIGGGKDGSSVVSYQPAQDPRRLFRDVSDLDKTVEELITDVLGRTVDLD
jgi:hypothetical protein